jgi:hypothetical protein
MEGKLEIHILQKATLDDFENLWFEMTELTNTSVMKQWSNMNEKLKLHGMKDSARAIKVVII